MSYAGRNFSELREAFPRCAKYIVRYREIYGDIGRYMEI